MTIVSSLTSPTNSAAAPAGASSASVSSSTVDTTLTEADVVDAAYQSALAPANDLLTRITANETKISAYQTMQTALESLQNSLSALHDSTDTTGDAFSQRSAALSTSNSNSGVEMSATVSPGTPAGAHQIVVEQIATAERIGSADVGDQTTPLGYSGTLAIGEGSGTSADITVSSNMSLNDIESAINAQTATTGVSASILQVSSTQYMMVLTAQDTNEAVSLTSVSGTDIAQSLGFLDASGNDADVLQQAQPALLKVDGVDGIQRDSNNINDVIEGVTLDLTQADASTTVTMTIGPDTSTVESAINDFVTAYNSWREFVMENQATSTDGSAASGAVLFGDPLVRSANQQIENALGSLVDNNALAAFGITFDNNDLLQVDATTLASTLQQNFSAIQSLFDFQATTTDSALALTSHSGSFFSGSFTLNIATDASGNVTSADVGGDTSLFTVSGNLIEGAAGTEYAGLQFYYSGGASTSVGVQVGQGVGDQVYQLADNYANTLTGLLTEQISSLTSQDSDMQSEVSQIETSANNYRSFLLSQYAVLEAQISQNDTEMSLISTLIAYDTKNG